MCHLPWEAKTVSQAQCLIRFKLKSMLSVILLLFIGLQSGLSSSLFQRECSLKVPENYSTSLPPKILDAEGNRVPLSVQIHSGGTEIEYVEEQTGRIGIAMIFEIKWHDPNIFALGLSKIS